MYDWRGVGQNVKQKVKVLHNSRPQICLNFITNLVYIFQACLLTAAYNVIRGTYIFYLSNPMTMSI